MKSTHTPHWVDKGTYKEPIGDKNVRVPRLEVDDATTYIDKDGSDNLTFTDAVTGTKTLAQLSATGTVDTSGTPADNDYAKFTDADTIEGMSYSEVKTDLSLNNVENTAHSTDAHTMTIDGRDVSVDGTKLDGIAANATKYPDTGEQAFLDADHSKLDAIEATADITDATNVAAAGALMVADLENPPTEDEASKAPTSEWAFDHNANATAHQDAPTLISDHAGDADAHGEPVVTCDTNSATADDLAFSIVGGEGIDTSGATTVVTIACEAASTTNIGAVELATGAETNTGTSATLAVTPDGLDDWTGSAQITTVGTLSAGNVTAQVSAASDTAAGKVELATGAETNTGTSTTLAVTPDGLDDWTGSGQITTVGTLSSGDVTAQVSAASTTAAGKSELAIASEINAGDDTVRTISPKELSDSNYGKRIMYIKVLANDTAVTTGDGKAIVTIPIELNGMNLVLAHAAVYTTSSGAAPAISLLNLDGGNSGTEMLSTSITIDASELTSYTASTPPVIDGGEDDVATGNRISVNVDTAGTGTKGLDVILTFQLP